MSTNKLADIGLNKEHMEEVRKEINDKMRQNKTTYHVPRQMPSEHELPLDKEGNLTVTLVHLALYNH